MYLKSKLFLASIFTIVSNDYKKLPEYFITAVKDWMIEEEIDDPKKINLLTKDNKVEVLNINIFN